jgi:hypothetical protein
MAESQRAFCGKETRTPSFKPGVEPMRCYFIRGGHFVDVEVLSDLSDEEVITKAKLLFSEHAGPIDGFEVWDSARAIFKHRPDLKSRTEKAGDSGRRSWVGP